MAIQEGVTSDKSKGQIFFGELTFTSLGGMMDFFTPEFLDMMGREADISQVKHR